MINNQRRFGGTIEGALARQNPQRQRLAQEHALAQAAQQQQRRQQPTQLPNRAADIDPHAKLATNLRSLLDFWREYQFGIGDNKPARSFTNAEKNQQGAAFKQKYWRRMKIWRIQSYLINASLTIEEANQRIINAFEHDSPTAIIHCIIRDQKHPTYQFVGCQRFRPRLLVNTR